MSSKVFRRIAQRIERVVRGVSLKPYAKDTAERIRRRTRTGQGLQETKRGAKRKKLKKLSDKYKVFRRKNKREISKNTKPSKSNLTLTGQLLDSIVGRARGTKIIVEFLEKRKDGLKNRDIARYQSEQGRDFFELSDKELRGLQNDIKKDLIKRLKKLK